MKFKAMAVFAAALAASTMTATAADAATLIGDTVTISANSNGVAQTSRTVVVGAGEEGDFFGNQFFDFGADTFSIRSTTRYAGLFNTAGTAGFTLSSLDFGTPITAVNVVTSLQGVITTFTSNAVTFSFAEQTIPAATYLSATFQTATAAVPEPATWAMMLFGFGAIGFAMRSAKRRSDVRFDARIKRIAAGLEA